MKKLLSLLLTAALLLSLPAAALAAGETPDYSGLVTDAYTYSYSDDWGDFNYHVPKIDRAGAGVAALNAAIWHDLYEGYMADVIYAREYAYEDYWPNASGLRYSWAVNGDVLSICAMVEGQTDNDTYYIYNMSLSSGERMSDRELFDAAGVTREQFNDLVRSALSASFDELSQYVGSGALEDSFLQERRSSSVADENIALSVPYMGPGGALCAVAREYAIAGADCYWHTYTLVPGDMQAQLDEFVEHCDDRYFSRSDIEGFDDQMCLYARNSVYAKLGWIFEMPELQEYFSQFDWYSPTLDPSQFSPDMLNDFQKANVDLVLAYEAEHGY